MKKAAFTKIEDLKKRYHRALKGNEMVVGLVDEAEIAENVYNSNAIENSTLTLEETEKILLEIDLERYISQRELFEAKNLARVMEYIRKMAKERELSSGMILLLHKMLLSNINNDIAGRFRKNNELVRVGSHIAPPAAEIDSRVKEMLEEYQLNTTHHIIARIAALHLAFEYTHPFIDGNGRIGRVMNNYLLIREDYVPINIKFIDRDKYYAAFREYDTKGKTEIMQEIVTKALSNSFYKRLAYLEGKKIVKLAEYVKVSGQSHSNLLNKAKRQTIEAFSEKGAWKIGV